MTSNLGKLLVMLGLFIAALGGVVLLLGRFVRLGHLPGDIHIERRGGAFSFPIVTCLLLSLVLTVLLNVVVRLFRR